MSRAMLEADLFAARREVERLEKALKGYLNACDIETPANVITINNTTISWAGLSSGSVCDPDLVGDVRKFIAGAMRAVSE